MRSGFLALAAAALLAACTHAPCCGDGDCSGNGICSAQCGQNGGHSGECLLRCQVDPDCGVGSVCNGFPQGCACVPAPADGGPGSCPRGTGT